eukprot:gene4239-4658_t
MSADALTYSSRAFYERVKSKFVFSFVLGGGAMLMLGFCSSAGGQAQAASKTDYGNSDAKDALVSGYGFATFCFIVSFLLLTIAAIYLSPLFCGSPNEKKVLRSPQEVEETSYSAYSETTPSAAHNSVNAAASQV